MTGREHAASGEPRWKNDGPWSGYVLRCSCGEGFCAKTPDEAVFMWQSHATAREQPA